MEGTCNLSEIFKQMATSVKLLDTSIHEIQVSWTGPDKLKQANYDPTIFAQRSDVSPCSTPIGVPKGYGSDGNT